MYQYSLYFFKSIYAVHFYYKVDILYRFLSQYHYGKLQDRSSLKQVGFVLEEINIEEITQHFLSHHLDYVIERSVNQECHELTIKGNGQEMKVVQNGYAIDVYADSLIDADQLFFRYIKEYHPYVFVVNFEAQECGWILPLAKKANYNL
ncbi:sporulation inhibitor of replication protein SirA [Alkalibacillus aidingensis]|uniref:sporulation inhibitor of replication protein SirA n=1 Tax=Alkalibacillus aidingensis TaxID=2747607 RepID=UPI00166067EF|nr:sporulation inhibitor of replication protein SirA [Alkalibacillus aidingensis]